LGKEIFRKKEPQKKKQREKRWNPNARRGGHNSLDLRGGKEHQGTEKENKADIKLLP